MDVNNIKYSIARFIQDDIVYIKVHVKYCIYSEFNLEIKKSVLLAAGCPGFRTDLVKVSKWLDNNKNFVVEQIEEQLRKL